MRAPYGALGNERATVNLVKFLRDRGFSYRGIGWELAKAGHKPRTGERWHANTIRRIAQRPNL